MLSLLIISSLGACSSSVDTGNPITNEANKPENGANINESQDPSGPSGSINALPPGSEGHGGQTQDEAGSADPLLNL